MDAKQFRANIVREPLEILDIHSPAAEELLMVIAAHESKLGHYVKQINGPALGPFQMEKETYWDVINNVLQQPRWRPLYNRMIGSCQSWIREQHHVEQLKTNWWLATIMARVYFMRWEEPIPKRENFPDKRVWINALAEYSKRKWNTSAGAATPEDYTNAYVRHVDPDL